MARHADRPIVCFLEIDDLLVTATKADWRTATSAFASLDRRNVAIVLCSGRTHGELAALTRALGFWHPFIAEDGCAICLPHAYFVRGVPDASQGFFWDVIDYGRSYRGVTMVVKTVARRLEIDIPPPGDAEAGPAPSVFSFPRSLASRAIKRSYGEVFRLPVGSEASTDRLVAALRAEGLRCTQRGRDLYVVPDHGGSRAVLRLRRLFLEHFADVQFVGITTPGGAGLVPAVMDTCLDAGCATLRAVAQLTTDVVEEVRLFGASAVRPVTAPAATGYRESRGADGFRLQQSR